MEIRELRATDGPAIHRSLLSDPEVAVWFRSSGPFTPAECEEMVVKKVAHRAAHGFGWSLGWEGEDCIGWGVAQYCILDGVAEVEIGWTVARSHWRRGIATQLGEHALREVGSLGLNSIVAYTREDNVASRGVMTKLGMTYDKGFARDGEALVIYRMPLAA
jgi:RimJ/RimL family protein N-acetyltransferase